MFFLPKSRHPGFSLQSAAPVGPHKKHWCPQQFVCARYEKRGPSSSKIIVGIESAVYQHHPPAFSHYESDTLHLTTQSFGQGLQGFHISLLVIIISVAAFQPLASEPRIRVGRWPASPQSVRLHISNYPKCWPYRRAETRLHIHRCSQDFRTAGPSFLHPYSASNTVQVPNFLHIFSSVSPQQPPIRPDFRKEGPCLSIKYPGQEPCLRTLLATSPCSAIIPPGRSLPQCTLQHLHSSMLFFQVPSSTQKGLVKRFITL